MFKYKKALSQGENNEFVKKSLNWNIKITMLEKQKCYRDAQLTENDNEIRDMKEKLFETNQKLEAANKELGLLKSKPSG